MTLDLEERNSVQDGSENPPPNSVIFGLCLNTIKSLFDLVKYCFWSGEETPGVCRPVVVRVRTAYSIAAT